MNDKEAAIQAKRISEFRRLESLYNEARTALTAITGPQEDGPCGQGPFTGNTRESRQVSSMRIMFTATRGGAPSTEATIGPLHIEAYELGKCLSSLLESRMEIIAAEMKNL